MKTQKLLNGLLIASLLSIPALSMAAMDGKGSGDMDKIKAMSKDHDMMRDKTSAHDAAMDRDQSKDYLNDGAAIYGYQMMNNAEVKQYRESLRAAKTKEERLKLMIEHRKEMQMRAKEKGVELTNEE
ncbi:hypothetical protein [Thalassolituus sp.]|jgi:hypothetical protein|uniref:hypothetical protein n=1 Tax=Thalassolituus sp. TaxID=2030822 RepID=UPI002A824349|nr:hypothetical protein [Thalassolituus sp.]